MSAFEIGAVRSSSKVVRAKRWASKQNWFLLWLIPVIAGLLLWQAIPIVSSFVMSFTDYKTGAAINTAAWVGLHNYIFALSDPAFVAAIKNTLYFAFFGVLIKNLYALFIAQLLFSIKSKTSFFRTMVFLPVITPPLATIILFLYIYQFQYGTLNHFLTLFGIPRIAWLTDPFWAKPSIIFMITWNSSGAAAIILLAGLGTIPNELREAARIDGANGWNVFWRITIPLMQRILGFVIITDAIDWLQIFTEPSVLTKGGPIYSSLSAVMLIQRTGLSQFHGGAASALAFILFSIILALTLIQLRFFRTSWEY